MLRGARALKKRSLERRERVLRRTTAFRKRSLEKGKTVLLVNAIYVVMYIAPFPFLWLADTGSGWLG